jgi:hypothetical protein
LCDPAGDAMWVHSSSPGPLCSAVVTESASTHTVHQAARHLPRVRNVGDQREGTQGRQQRLGRERERQEVQQLPTQVHPERQNPPRALYIHTGQFWSTLKQPNVGQSGGCGGGEEDAAARHRRGGRRWGVRGEQVRAGALGTSHGEITGMLNSSHSATATENMGHVRVGTPHMGALRVHTVTTTQLKMGGGGVSSCGARPPQGTAHGRTFEGSGPVIRWQPPADTAARRLAKRQSCAPAPARGKGDVGRLAESLVGQTVTFPRRGPMVSDHEGLRQSRAVRAADCVCLYSRVGYRVCWCWSAGRGCVWAGAVAVPAPCACQPCTWYLGPAALPHQTQGALPLLQALVFRAHGWMGSPCHALWDTRLGGRFLLAGSRSPAPFA